MSTKIYDGLITVPAGRDLFEFMAAVKAVIEPIYHAHFEKVAREALVHKANGTTWAEAFHIPPRTDVPLVASYHLGELGWDAPIVKGPYDTCEIIYHASKILERQVTINWSPLDFTYKVVLLPNGNPSSGHYQPPPLMLLFSERLGQEMRSALMDAGLVEEYGYWNNTDRPDGMKKREWRERKTAWDTLDVPADDGLEFGTPTMFEAMFDLGTKLTTEAREARDPFFALDNIVERVREKVRHPDYYADWFERGQSQRLFAEMMADLDTLGVPR